jgi:hypothetical protein
MPSHRNGFDTATGAHEFADGTFRGVMVGVIDRTTDMTFALPLAGGECHAPTRTTQQLWVVGTIAHGGSLIPNATSSCRAPRATDLVLSFYPLEAAKRIGKCDEPIPYSGEAVLDGKRIVGPYAPFNDARWSTPDIGYRIHLPDPGGKLEYEDWEQVLPATGVDSQWNIDVERSE